jgi:hypothetical protein
MTDFERNSIIVNAIAAAGTLLLAIIAIFGSLIKRLIIKPKIQGYIDSCKPFIEMVKETDPTESKEISFKKIHLKINNKGRQTALNSQILIEKIFKKREESQTYFLYKSFIPSNFLWEDENKSKPITTSISHYIEIARIQKYVEFSKDEGEGSITRRRDYYRLWLSIEDPIKGSYLLLGKGTFVFPIIVYSDNVSTPLTIFLEIFWNSDNLDDMNESTFYVKLLSKKELTNEIKSEL